ncbi:DUF4102 domain-containing protein [Providencia stuartii]|nr:DUF4102 domain-containing protein [Providencia stuartii]NPD97175.1 DUF4102 domain-containing protein [Providencia stuartii]
MSLAEAREKRKQVANGIDPVEERKAQKLAQQLSVENGTPTKPIAGQWPTAKKL